MVQPLLYLEYNWDANAGSDVASYKVMGVDSGSGSVTSAASQLYVPVNPDNESIYSIQPLDDNSFLILGRRLMMLPLTVRYFMRAMI